MPIGILVNTLAVMAGGVFGTLLKRALPERLKRELPLGFGLCAIAIGVGSIVKLNNMTAVVLATLIGYAVGNVLCLERRIQGAFDAALKKLRLGNADMDLYIVAVTLFCCSAMGWYGAIAEGISGNTDILMSKSVLDFFTAIIFASTLGWAICAIPFPQIAVLLIMFALGRLLAPLLAPEAFQDLTACGGILAIASGLRIMKIREIRVIDFAPSLILVMPISMLLQTML